MYLFCNFVRCVVVFCLRDPVLREERTLSVLCCTKCYTEEYKQMHADAVTALCNLMFITF